MIPANPMERDRPEPGTTRLFSPVVPFARLLRLLGIRADELGPETVSVRSAGLQKLLQEVARMQPFDPEFYARTYPDIEAARLGGVISDLHDHFVRQGFQEGRLAAEPPFDPVWYAQYYPDVARAFPAGDAAALRNHFFSTGLAEGRSGTAAGLSSPNPWGLD